jgi:alpha,alpha-trehalase
VIGWNDIKMDYTSIRDYAIIGNLRSAALVSKHGSIDWACVPYLDSPSVFGAILDVKKGGSWQIVPVDDYKSTQKYLGDTNILVTSFKTKTGEVDLIDFIPIVDVQYRKKNLEREPMFRLYRKVVCHKGKVEMKLIFTPRFHYAEGKTILTKVDHGVKAEHNDGKHFGLMLSSQNFSVTSDRATVTMNLKRGEEHFFIFHNHRKKILENKQKLFEKKYHETKKFWENWVSGCDLSICQLMPGVKEMVLRSLLVLKTLSFDPPGTIAAAATTSLPEVMGGVRNWDYRFTWLRDSSFTLQAMFRLGHTEEAEKYVNWLVNSCSKEIKDDPSHIQIMYGLRGEHNLKEQILPHLEGYMGSHPVRIGNGAYDQKQWDIYGSVIDTVWKLHELKGHVGCDQETWEVVRALANHVVTIWQEPDEGLWEVRGGQRHFVYSKIMCWVALDRAIKIAKKFNHAGPINIWSRERNKIKRQVFKCGWSKKKKSFTQSFDDDALDASVLLMPVYGFVEGADPRMLSTIKAVEKELSTGKGLLYRYKSNDGLPGEEGIFLLSSFWLVDALVLAGKKKNALKIFNKLVSFANHVGLYSEEMNPKTKEFLGNFPQAYTHIGLINSAFYLSGPE